MKLMAKMIVIAVSMLAAGQVLAAAAKSHGSKVSGSVHAMRESPGV